MTNYPTIGIRPIIDGRRFGVRESLDLRHTAAQQLVGKVTAKSYYSHQRNPRSSCPNTHFS